MRKILLRLCLLSAASSNITAQDSVWTLKKCIEHAKKNNLTVQLSALNERRAEIQWEQDKLSSLPNISINSSYGRNFGRSIDPTTNTFNSNVYDFTGISSSGSILLFGWFRTRNIIKKSHIQLLSATADLYQQEQNISLNIAAAYLRVLLAKEQVHIIQSKMGVSLEQLNRTQILLTVGRSNGLDFAQVKTQLSTDSAEFFKTKLNLQQAEIDIKALLNLELSSSFPVTPFMDLNCDSLANNDPEEVYQSALLTFGGVRSAELKIKAAEKDLLVAKGNLYPKLVISASTGSNYSSTYIEYLPNGEKRLMPFQKQFGTNFSQSLNLGITVPIFNGLSSRYHIRQARFNIQESIIHNQEVRLKLKQEIYKACIDADMAYHTYRTSQNTVLLARTALDFAKKRYEKGLIRAIETLTAQNTEFKAEIEEVVAKYNLIFKLRLIQFYRGNQLE